MTNRAFLSAWYLLATSFLLSGCAHSYLKAGGDLATSLKKGDTALAQLSDSEANTQRVYQHVQLAYNNLGIKKESEVPAQFVAQVCMPFSEGVLTAEQVALANIDKYQAYLESKSTDPKDKSLTALISSFSSSRSLFLPADSIDAVKAYDVEKKNSYIRCAEDVRNTFVAPSSSRTLSGAAALAAWPKVKAFITILLMEENKNARENAIIESLKNTETRQALDDSLKVLKDSTAGGDLGKLAIRQKQLALWAAYADYRTLVPDQAEDETKEKLTPQTPNLSIEAFQKTNFLAVRMANNMKAYNEFASINPADIVKKMERSLQTLQTAANNGAAPDDTWYAEIIAALDFFAEASDKYAAASSALLVSK